MALTSDEPPRAVLRAAPGAGLSLCLFFFFFFFSRRPGGGVGAEIVVATPLLMLLILLVIQFGIWAHAPTHVAQATAEEALAAARVQGGTAAAGQARARQVLGQIGGAILLSPHVSVTLSHRHHRHGGRSPPTAERVLPAAGPGGLPVTVTVTGPVERFVPATRQR